MRFLLLWESDFLDFMNIRLSRIFGYHGYSDIMDIWTSWIFGHHGYLDIMHIRTSRDVKGTLTYYFLLG